MVSDSNSSLGSFIVILLFGVTLLGCTEDTTTPSDPPSNISHDVSWIADTIGAYSSGLKSVWGASRNDVYAVGFIRFSDSSSPTNIMHWNGAAWSALDYLEGDLRDIIGFGPADIWVVGFWQVSSQAYSLIGHWNGSVWQTWKMQEYPGLISIWGTSSTNLFACGFDGTILKYDGSSWIEMDSGTQHTLYGIWGNSNVTYSVGGNPSTGVGVVLKRESNAWIKLLEKPYDMNFLSGRMSAVWGLLSDNFYLDVYRGHDSTWQKLSAPYDNTYVEDTYGISENDIFIVGHFGLIMHYNGSTWTRYDQVYRKPGSDVLFGVWFDNTSVFAVGTTSGGRAIVYRGTRDDG